MGPYEAKLRKVKIFSLRLKFQLFQALLPTLQSELSWIWVNIFTCKSTLTDKVSEVASGWNEVRFEPESSFGWQILRQIHLIL